MIVRVPAEKERRCCGEPGPEARSGASADQSGHGGEVDGEAADAVIVPGEQQRHHPQVGGQQRQLKKGQLRTDEAVEDEQHKEEKEDEANCEAEQNTVVIIACY